VGTAIWVVVAEGGNQTIVGVGVAVSFGIGVSVGSAKFTGRQATREKNPQSTNRIGNTFIKEFLQAVVQLLRKRSIADSIVPDEEYNAAASRVA
jgi:hypothetical protein